MPDQADLVQTIYSAIFSGLGVSTAADPNSYISLEWPGIPISAADYQNPWSAANTGGSQLNTENFSVLVDAIPSPSPVYSLSGLGVESVYSLILSATVGGSSGAIAQAFTAAQLGFATSAIGSALSPSNSYHPSYPQPSGWCTSSAGWTSIDTSLSTAAAATGSTAPKLASSVVSASLSTAVKQALKLHPELIGWRSASIAPGTLNKLAVPLQVHPDLRIPQAAAAVMAPRALLAMPAVSRDGLLQVRSANALISKTVILPPATVNPPVRLGVDPQPVALHPAPVAAPPSLQAKPITSSALKLTLQCQRVTVLRQWLNPLLFHLGGWSIDGMAAGSISAGSPHGDPTGNAGFFALLPMSFVVVKDVKLTGSWSADDKTFASQATSPNSVVAFGPLTLSNPAASQSTFDGITLTVPGMQIIAWASSLTPELPPS